MNSKDKTFVVEQRLILERVFRDLSKSPPPPSIPVIFQDLCSKCGKEKPHRSYIAEKEPVQQEFYAAAVTTMVAYPIAAFTPKNLLKICLSCGERTYLKVT